MIRVYFPEQSRSETFKKRGKYYEFPETNQNILSLFGGVEHFHKLSDFFPNSGTMKGSSGGQRRVEKRTTQGGTARPLAIRPKNALEVFSREN